MNLFAVISLVVSISSASLAIQTFLQARNKLHWIWGVFNLNVCLWCAGLFFVAMSRSSVEALDYWKLTFVPNIFISAFLYHLVHSFCQLKGRRFLVFAYMQAFFFACVALFSKEFATEPKLIFNTIYYVEQTPWLSCWLSTFSFVTVVAFYKVWQFIRVATGENLREAVFLFWGMLIGFGGGYTIAFPIYGIHIYPAWHFLICVYTGIFTFAVLRNNFLDIRIALTRFLFPVGIFAGVSFLFCFIYFEMNFFTAISLALAILCSLLSYVIFAYARERMHYVWALFNIAVALWGYSAFFIGGSHDPQVALILWRVAFCWVLFIGIFFYHVICLFCKIQRFRIILFAYIQGVFFLLLNTTNLFISKVSNDKFPFYYIESHGYFYPISFALWCGLVFLGLYELIRYFPRAVGIRRQQCLYLFFGFGVGFLGGVSNFLPTFGIPVYPFGNLTISFYCIIATYAIFRYQLMDIRIAITRIGVFVVVYSLVLGIPFGLAIWRKPWLMSLVGENWFWIPMITLVILATVGPYIFIYLQRKTEKNILQVEQGTQDSLNQASYGMNIIHNLDKLLNLIIDVVVKTLRLDSARIFLLDREAENYISRAPESKHEITLDKEDPLILELKKKQYPLVHDEIKMLSDGGDKTLLDVEAQMRNLSASIIVPIVLNNSLLGFLTLGERKSKAMYTRGLLNTLSILGNQAGLAIDRCNYIAAETKRLEAEGLKERMVSLDHMASSMAHEIDNPMHIIRSSLSFVKDFLLKDARVSALPVEIKNDFEEAIVRSLQAGDRVSGMIKAILDYSRMGTGKLESVRIGEALDGFMQLIQPQIREEKVLFTKEIENDLPQVLGDRVQMEEIFMNFVRNSLHAVRRNEEKKITLKILRKNKDIVRIECSDNGYGIPKEIINDIFLSSMTTKGSSEGTGLGLYRVRKIVDLFRGKVWAESEGKEKGATFIVELPVYSADRRSDL